MIDEERVSVQLQQAREHRANKQPQEAASIYQSILAIDADNYEANYSLGMLCYEASRNDLAIPLIQKSIDIQPEVFAGHINLGMMQRDEQLLGDSRVSLEKAVKIQPESAVAHVTLGLLYIDVGELDLAVDEINHGLKLEPNDPMTHARMGMLRQVRGEIEEAEHSFNEVLAISPQDLDAHRSLALLRRQKDHNDNTKWLENEFNRPGIADRRRVLLGFTLSKVFDDLGQYDKAFEHLSVAHRLHRRSSDYSVEHQIESFSRHKQALNKKLIERCKAHVFNDETPIFILGMPRSGTSLTEQILASHPSVYGAGEVEYMRYFSTAVEQQTHSPFPQHIDKVPSELLQAAAKAYIGKLKLNAGNALNVVDKLPHNFLRVGLIAAVMPRAKIILCERDPMDNCVSMFQNLLGPAHPYASDLYELGHYYRLYQDLMKWWEEILPGHMYRVRYEFMVAEPERQVRGLLQFCNLPFHEDCLSFHKTKRQIKTPSEAQVRQPMYQSSVGRWRNYEQYLGPLREGLGV